MLTAPFVLTAVFFLLILGIACWGLRQTSTVGDYFLGGKTLGPWLLAISYGTTYFSAAAFIGFAGRLGWQYGLNVLWIALGNTFLGGFLAWVVLGKQTRRMSHNLNSMTMPEFFGTRYDSQKMKAFSALIIFAFMIPYSASIFQGLSYLFESTFEIPFWLALLIITVFASVYIMIGGYKAVARVDFLQGMIMFVGAILMVTFLVSRFGGVANVLESINSIRAERMTLDPADPLVIKPPLSVWILPGLVFMTSFGVWGMPQMVHKYYAIRDERQILRGAIVTTVFALFVVCSAYFVGTMCPLLEKDLLLPNGAEKINMESLVPTLLTTKLPQSMLALILLLVLSASISTLTSLVLVSASAVTIDLYKGYLNPNATQSRMLLLMRVLSAVFIMASFVVTISQVTWIITLMSVSWGAVAGSFMAPFLYGLFWKRTTKAGAYAGMVTGLILSNGLFFGCLYFYDLPRANAFSTVFASIAMLVPFIVVPIVSLMTKPPKTEVVERAFGNAE